MLIKIIVALAIGGISGFAANKLMNGKSGSALQNIVLGLIGGIVGGFLGNLIGIGDGWISGILLSIGGSCLVIWLARKLAK